MDSFKRTTNGFNYVYERQLKAGETRYLKMPAIAPNKRGINDIGWQTDGDDVKLYGTLSSKPTEDKALWQEIISHDDVNKTVSALKIENGGSECKIIIRAILN